MYGKVEIGRKLHELAEKNKQTKWDEGLKKLSKGAKWPLESENSFCICSKQACFQCENSRQEANPKPTFHKWFFFYKQ